MPSPFFWGGLMKGAGQGFEKGQRLQLDREEAKLKAKMLDAQIKHMDAQERSAALKEKQTQDALTGRQRVADMYLDEATGAKPGQPQLETDVGDQPVGLQVAGQPGAPTAGRKPTLQEILTHGAIRESNSAQALSALSKVEDNSPETQWNRIMQQDMLMKRYQQMQNPQATQPQQVPQVAPGPDAPTTPQATPASSPTPTQPQTPPYRITFDAKGKPKLTPTPAGGDRAPFSIVDRTYFDARKAGKSHEEALTLAASARKDVNIAGGEGSAQGTFNAKRDPSNQQTERDFKQAGAEGATAGGAVPAGVQDNLNDTRTILSDIGGALSRINPSTVAKIGPLAGKQAGLQETFGETPFLGGLVGGPLTPEQSELRQFTARARNIIRNARYGATLTTGEKAAAEEELASLEKSPTSFITRMQNLKRIFSQVEQRIIGSGKMTRGNLGQEQAAPRGAPRIISITPVQ